MPKPSNDPALHNERRLAHLEEATLVMSRLQSDTARTMAELREATELDTRWLLEQEKWSTHPVPNSILLKR